MTASHAAGGRGPEGRADPGQGRGPLRVLMLNGRYAPRPGRGAAVAVEALAHTLAARDDVTVTVLSAGPTPGLRRRVHDGVPVVEVGVPSARPGRADRRAGHWPHDRSGRPDQPAQALVGALRAVLGEVRPHLVHSHILAPFDMWAWRIAQEAGAAVVHTLHEWSWMCAQQVALSSGNPCSRPCPGCAATLAATVAAGDPVTAVIADGQNLLRTAARLGTFRNARIWAAIPPATLMPPIPPQAPRTGPLVAGFLGELVPPKGIQWLLEAIAPLPAEGWSLLVGGDGPAPLAEPLRRLYGRPPVSFLGRVDRHAFLSQIDLLVMPSLWAEPWGLVSPEALVHGVPVLTSGRGGQAEIAAEADSAAMVFNPDRPETFRDTLHALIGDPARARALAPIARSAGLRLLDPAAMAAAHLQVYRAVLAGSEPAGGGNVLR